MYSEKKTEMTKKRTKKYRQVYDANLSCCEDIHRVQRTNTQTG